MVRFTILDLYVYKLYIYTCIYIYISKLSHLAWCQVRNIDTADTQAIEEPHTQEDNFEPELPDNQLGMEEYQEYEEDDTEHVTPHDNPSYIELNQEDHEYFKDYAEAGGFSKEEGQDDLEGLGSQPVAPIPTAHALEDSADAERESVEDLERLRQLKAEVMPIESDEERTTKGVYKEREI